MNRDTVVGIVGAAILVTAMVGVFWYERNNALAAGDPAEGGEATPPPAPLTGTVALGETQTLLANVTNATARNVTFHLTWTATNGRDTLKLTVAPPTGSGIMEGAVSEPSDSGEIHLSVAVPEGASPVGDWEVKVEFVGAAPAPLPGGAPPPVTPPGSTDGSVDFSVAVAYG